jgi:hypothetical protein
MFGVIPFELSDISDVHACELFAPTIKRLFCHILFSADVANVPRGFSFLKNPDDLLLVESLLHSDSSSMEKS